VPADDSVYSADKGEGIGELGVELEVEGQALELAEI
jgi:hypothetical protein